MSKVREEPGGTSVEFGTIEFPLEVKAAGKPRHVEIDMTARLLVTGVRYFRTDAQWRKSFQQDYEEKGVKPTPQQMEEDIRRAKEEMKGEVTDTQNPPPGHEQQVAELKEMIKGVDFVATIDDGGRIVGFTGRGKALEDLKNMPDAKERALRERYMGGKYRSVLDDSLAYLPSQPVRVGQSWKVSRPEVFPIHEYAIGMLTGCASLSEKATCRLDSVCDTPEGRIAVIKMSGRRDAVPEFQVAGKPTGAYLVSGGEIQVNLTTGRLVSLRIESKAHWKSDKDDHPEAVFTDSLTLAPLTLR